MISVPINIERPNAEVLADIDRVWERTKHVPMGGVPDSETIEFMRAGERGGLVSV
jgi:hypothetical protein